MAEIEDTYFRRLFVPIVVSILLLCGAAAVIVVPPGRPVKWETSATALKGGSGSFWNIGKK